MIALLAVAALGAALAAVSAALTAYNVAAWPRGRDTGRATGRVSVCIPARNEQASIERAVRAALASRPAADEVIVCDDHSSDDTAAILARLAAGEPRLQIIQPPALPAGWVGKPHACHRLAQAASGQRLVFLDADVAIEPDGLARLHDLAERLDASCVTAMPRQRTGSIAEALILPILHATYTSWFPLPLTWRSRDVRFLAANGQILSVDRGALEAVGGFASIRAELVDDMALCRALKSSGERVAFVDGYSIASCRMYRGAAELWRGFSKNLYEGLGARPAPLALVLALYTLAFLVPWAALGLGFIIESAPLAALGGVGVGAALAMRLTIAWRFGYPFVGALAHPIGVLFAGAIALNSARWYEAGRVIWAGRVYEKREARKGAT